MNTIVMYAFPTTPVSHGYDPEESGYGTGCGPGMELRDWFAGQVVAGIKSDAPPAMIADYCYRLADEMIIRRKHGKEK